NSVQVRIELAVRASSFAGAVSSSTQSAEVGTRFAIHKRLVVGFETLLNYKCCVTFASGTNVRVCVGSDPIVEFTGINRVARPSCEFDHPSGKMCSHVLPLLGMLRLSFLMGRLSVHTPPLPS